MNEFESMPKQSIEAGESIILVEEKWTGTVDEVDGETARVILDPQYHKQQEALNPGKGFIEVSLSEIKRIL